MRSRARGYGTDLAGARPYRPGDDVRRIDWRASARLSSARGSDDFVVREHLTEEATRVILAVDRSPTMELYPPGFPWLCKPVAIEEASAMILESALQAGCAVGYLGEGPRTDAGAYGPAEDARARSDLGLGESWRVRREELPSEGADSPCDSVAAILAQLAGEARTLPPGTFVFLLSDFLDFPGDEVWQEALDTALDLIPVIVQDPVWERSFPDVAGAVLPLADPATGRVTYVRLSRKDVEARRKENRARLHAILGRFEAYGLDHALISSHEPGRVLASFVEWATARHQGARLA
jgi:uncharacterized protein (DUF58 family)